MTEMLVRAIAEGDEEEVVALWQRCGLTRPWNDPATDLAFARGKPNSEVFVGLLEDKIIASAMAGHDGHRGVAYYVAVDPDARGKSHGRHIMSAVEDWLRGKGVWKVNLMVRTGNAPVLQFYDRLGYRPSATTVIEKWIDPSKRGDKSGGQSK